MLQGEVRNWRKRGLSGRQQALCESKSHRLCPKSMAQLRIPLRRVLCMTFNAKLTSFTGANPVADFPAIDEALEYSLSIG
eukprot:scaffold3045_cov134-Pinguiococcus_pyrenoidosus.AAC.3